MAAFREVELRGEKFLLHGARLLLWPKRGILGVADMHLGKAQTFQKSGFWLPPEAHLEDLATLARVAREHALEHLVFLGDFVHARAGVTKEIVAAFAEWGGAFPGKITVIVGNHDRPLVNHWPKEWSFVELTEVLSFGEGITLVHEPPLQNDGTFTWCGHIHPKVSLERGAESLYLPAFVLTENIGYVPAFSSLAGGAHFPFKKGNRYFVTTGADVTEIAGTRAARAPREAPAGN